MARALVSFPLILTMEFTLQSQPAGGVRVPLRALALGPDVQPNGFRDLDTSVIFLDADTGPQMLQNITTAVVDGFAAKGITVARADVRIPQFSKGT